MAKTKAELMAEKLKQKQVGKAAFQAGKKPVAEEQPPVQEEVVEVVETVEVPVVTPEVPQIPSENLWDYVSATGTQGKKGEKVPRMNLGIPEDVYEYIRRESRKAGMTYSEFICAVMRQRQQKDAQ